MKYARADAKAYARQHMTGIWGAIPYPFKDDLELDEAGLRANIRRYIDGRLMDGIYIGQYMSEYWALTGAERKRAAEVVLDEAGGAVPVVVHVGHHSAKETVELAVHAEAAGATYLAVGPPHAPRLRPVIDSSDNGVYDYFRYISDRTQLGLVLINTGNSPVVLGPDMVNRLADLDNVVGLKNALPLNTTLETHRLAGDRIVVSDPNERNWLMLMVNFGFRLYMSALVPFLLQRPGHTPMMDYTALALSGEASKAAVVAYQMEPARNIHDKWIIQTSATRKVVAIAYLKAWCELMGMAGGAVRPPLSRISEAERNELRSDLEAVGLLGLERVRKIS